MLIGEYTHTIDDKKRLSLPVKFRKELGKKIVITHGLDNCLFVYPENEWKKVSEKLANLGVGQSDSRGFNRFMLGGAVEVSVDSIGRILIPDFLKEFARLKNKVAVIGVHARAEIWDQKAWAGYKKEIEGKADALAQKLGDVGAI
ncbi:division/cell wall cluster transcriptional repressor MraZ [Candidatus Campbellbacteria bacterium CG11_big_fil_rev_8_21_14_0_20_44_21]|uniref:Transcriptional regulator MraZ n=1 Tax=Candidatus Campbellbacteria bacterium CG22_combo_CG10-13_8_21_14_all_43_18 TaxID=1974530 RepID=A0A2H0DW52_9BACT|nr:MAG: division/cell wall cluster transcriptional repressor MraZ [Candidatus Campbellbacteria bacterium CG22_combo_CG10-13_8_21_14_all_43_18]PIR24289.1 MAG: division/cell wall cluster transcriptional repressor MraZ [Candidatus Campbellbacteria bacterium CG11_big_fil_rev_8_21_14_0_20_44_21]